MARGDTPRKGNSVAAQPSVYKAAANKAPARAPPSGVPASRVLTATSSTIHEIPTDVLCRQSLFYGNKVVLGFESEFSIARAREWVSSYNLWSSFPLTLVDELLHSLFVVLFQVEDLPAAKRTLLDASPLYVNGTFASVNDYTITFDPCEQADFRHLVTVQIPRGNQSIFNLIRYILPVIGKYVKAGLGPDHRRISAVAESTLKLFPAKGQFRLQDSIVSTIHFEYGGKNLRCCYCFSYRHLSVNCKEPHPRFFSSPDLVADVDLGTPAL